MVALTALALLLAAPVGRAQPLQLAGLLPLDDEQMARWPWSGAWIWPVGGECDYTQTRGDAPACKLLRGYATRARRRRPHEGADIGNGRAGDAVRAAAHGLVVAVRDGRDVTGFGDHVVVAHHLRDGDIAYSVYSHLQPGSITVHPGQCVWAGQSLGAVGRSGRATTDHLHFEVRLAANPGERWERARVVDPVAFVQRRLPRYAADTTGVGSYLDWADRAGLIPDDASAGQELRRTDWQFMLARAACLPLLSPPRDPAALGRLLVAHGLPAETGHARGSHPAWGDVARDVARLRELATRLPPLPFRPDAHRAACLARFRLAEPSADSTALAGHTGSLTLADACVLLADLAARAQAAIASPDGSR